MNSSYKIIECPRDAMQGLVTFIPTNKKIAYINKLLKIGFHTLDVGSFVSPKAVPQMKDTSEVIAHLDLSSTSTQLLAIVGNIRGAEQALSYDNIQNIGFPLSISETFQQRNTNTSTQDALNIVEDIQNLCASKGKTQVVYLSMGFGNPYGDPYSVEIVEQYVERLVRMDIKVVSLADTLGLATSESVFSLFKFVSHKFSEMEIGLHLHATPEVMLEKIEAAYLSGCRRIDAAMGGFGGCPLAKDELVGNISTEQLIQLLDAKGENLLLNRAILMEASHEAQRLFIG